LTFFYHCFVCLLLFAEKEVTFKNGIAGASSFLSDNFKPDKAFTKEEGEERWVSKDGKAPPHVIFYRFANPLKVTKVAFEAFHPSYGPTNFTLVAANDQNCNLKAWAYGKG
jgi:hypothetical protein